MQGVGRSNRQCLRIAEFIIDPFHNTVTGPGGKTHIEPKVVELALFFADRPNQLLTREELIDAVWDGAYGADQSLSAAISRLRKALKDDDPKRRLIVTVPKRGYQLQAPVEWLEHNQRNAIKPPLRRIMRTTTVFTVIAVVFAVLIGAVSWVLQSDGPHPANIAVLPFESLSNEPSDLIFAKSLSEEIADGLSRHLPNRVIGPTSSADILENGTAIASAKEHGIRMLIEGRVERLKDTQSVSIRVVDAQKGITIINETFGDGYTNPAGFRRAITSRLIDRLKLELRAPNFKHTNISPIALKAYFSGLASFRSNGWNTKSGRTLKNLKSAVNDLELAVSIAPDFAPAHARLAIAYTFIASSYANQSEQNIEDQKVELDNALFHASKALELDPKLSDAYLAKGLITAVAIPIRLDMRADYQAAKDAFQTALQLDPKNFEAMLQLALMEMEKGDAETAEEYLQLARNIDPLSRDVLLATARLMNWREQFEDARMILDRLIEYYPDFSEAYIAYGRLERSQGNIVQAVQYYQQGLSIERTPGLLFDLGSTYLDSSLHQISEIYFKEFFNEDWSVQRNIIRRDYEEYYDHLKTLVQTQSENSDLIVHSLYWARQLGKTADMPTYIEMLELDNKTELHSADVNIRNFRMIICVADVLEASGRLDEALVLRRKNLAFWQKQNVFTFWSGQMRVAEAQLALNVEAGAIDILRDALLNGPGKLYGPYWWGAGIHIADDRGFLPLHDNPEFWQLIVETEIRNSMRMNNPDALTFVPPHNSYD